LEQYFLLALIIIGFWVVGFILYLVSSNRQRDIQAEINHIDEMLEADEAGRVGE
jgi:Ni,Fe-hydrogenase I cytochrome b subunit